MDLRRSIGAFAQEAAQPDAILARLLQSPRHAHRALPGADHHHVVRRRKLAPDHAHHASRGQAEEQQQDPGVHREENQKEAAQVQAEDIFEDDQAQRAIGALPGRVAQDHARIPDIELFVDFQPEADRDPRRQGKGEHQGLALHSQIERALEMQHHARLIGRFKCQRGQEDVG